MKASSKYCRTLSLEVFEDIVATVQSHRFNRPSPLLTAQERRLAKAVLVEGIKPKDAAEAEGASTSTVYQACCAVLAHARGWARRG